MNEQPLMIIVSGGNGSGKTSMALEYVQDLSIPYVGADKIAYELCPDDPYSVSIEAGRQFIEKVNDMISCRFSFVVETTLSGVTFRKQIQQAKSHGFKITIIHVFLDNDNSGIARVSERMKKGGHYVPEVDISRRFLRSIFNFWKIYRTLADDWSLFYNGGNKPILVAFGDFNSHVCYDSNMLDKFLLMVNTYDSSKK